MRNFDEERQARLEQDRSFQINGETFTRRPGVAPEKVLPWVQMITGETDPTEADAITILDDTVLAYLEPGQEERWRVARDPESDNPVTIPDLRRLLEWLTQEDAGRPTGQSSASAGGRDDTKAILTAASSSPEVEGSPV